MARIISDSPGRCKTVAVLCENCRHPVDTTFRPLSGFSLLMNGSKTWLRLVESEPFFFYLHYNEPHRPYYPPGKYLDTSPTDLEMSVAKPPNVRSRSTTASMKSSHAVRPDR